MKLSKKQKRDKLKRQDAKARRSNMAKAMTDQREMKICPGWKDGKLTEYILIAIQDVQGYIDEVRMMGYVFGAMSSSAWGVGCFFVFRYKGDRDVVCKYLMDTFDHIGFPVAPLCMNPQCAIDIQVDRYAILLDDDDEDVNVLDGDNLPNDWIERELSNWDHVNANPDCDCSMCHCVKTGEPMSNMDMAMTNAEPATATRITWITPNIAEDDTESDKLVIMVPDTHADVMRCRDLGVSFGAIASVAQVDNSCWFIFLFKGDLRKALFDYLVEQYAAAGYAVDTECYAPDYRVFFYEDSRPVLIPYGPEQHTFETVPDTRVQEALLNVLPMADRSMIHKPKHDPLPTEKR